MNLKKEVMKKKLGLLKKKMDSMDCEDESDVMAEHKAELNETDVVDSDDEPEVSDKEEVAEEGEEDTDLDRNELRKFMRGEKEGPKKGTKTVLVASKPKPKESPFKGKSKRA